MEMFSRGTYQTEPQTNIPGILFPFKPIQRQKKLASFFQLAKGFMPHALFLPLSF
jgi:hypothetical protein